MNSWERGNALTNANTGVFEVVIVSLGCLKIDGSLIRDCHANGVLPSTFGFSSSKTSGHTEISIAGCEISGNFSAIA